MRDDPPAVLQARPGSGLTSRLFTHLLLAVGVEGIVDRCSEAYLLVVVPDRQLETPHYGIEATGFSLSPSASWNVRVANNPAHLGQSSVLRESLLLEHDFKGAHPVFVGKFRGPHVERAPFDLRRILARVYEHELGSRVDVPSNQPGTSRAVNVET